MDSLVANYASSDEEGEGELQRDGIPNSTPIPASSSSSSSSSSSKSLFGSLPPPKSSSSLFSSLPPPRSANSSLSHPSNSVEPPKTTSSSIFSVLPPPKSAPLPTPSSSIFSSLPPPKSGEQPTASNPEKTAPSGQKTKRVVQFTPPINPSLLKPLDDDDDDEDDKKRRRPAKDLSSKPLSSIMPAPKNSFGLAPLGSRSSSARKSVVENDAPSVCAKPEMSRPAEEEKSGVVEDYGSSYGNWGGGSGVEAQWSSGTEGAAAAPDSSGLVPTDGSYYENYANYGDASYSANWDYETTAATVAAETPPMQPDMRMIFGKRGRNDIPVNILEVKQDELVKNRPREDQAKLTGIAFGPAYQPVSSQKGKPSKLHKRKHQIGSLYFDMKQREMELTERRARGMLTKKETQGKYGW